jgi:phosphomannomutase
MMEILSKSKALLSSLTLPFQKYIRSGQINKAVADPLSFIAKISQHYKDGSLADFDGVRIDSPDWWFSVRASNTEPLLRLNVEAVSKELMEKKRDEILKLLEM